MIDSEYWARYYAVTRDRALADREEDTTTALGQPHHFHVIELVARGVSPS